MMDDHRGGESETEQYETPVLPRRGSAHAIQEEVLRKPGPQWNRRVTAQRQQREENTQAEREPEGPPELAPEDDAGEQEERTDRQKVKAVHGGIERHGRGQPAQERRDQVRQGLYGQRSVQNGVDAQALRPRRP